MDKTIFSAVMIFISIFFGIISSSETFQISMSENDTEFIEITTKEAVDIFKNGSKDGIIYFYGDECPWCEKTKDVIYQAADEMNVDYIYACDPTDERNNIPENVEGSEEYMELLVLLDKYLMDYTDEDGNPYGCKRIFIPDVYVVNNGEIIGRHLGTVESDTDSKTPLNEEQKEELLNIYKEMISNWRDINE